MVNYKKAAKVIPEKRINTPLACRLFIFLMATDRLATENPETLPGCSRYIFKGAEGAKI
jgi:hypothetical protein